MACATLSEALWWKPKQCPSDHSASPPDTALGHVPDSATTPRQKLFIQLGLAAYGPRRFSGGMRAGL